MSEDIAKKLVGLDFNPSANPDVTAIKTAFAELIARILSKQEETEDTVLINLCNEAAIQCVTAQMWAVKVATFKS